MMNKVLIITGPTGSGKTKLSLALAESIKTDIINGDAFQVYRQMNIGTAKILPSEQRGITHHLFDIIDPQEEFSVCDYQRLVRSLIDEMTFQNKLPLIVGGSGLYLDAVIRNYQFEATKRDVDFEKQYANYSNEALHQLLQKINANAANSIHYNNRKRVLRALEIALDPKTLGTTPKRSELLYDALIIYLDDDRDTLYQHLNSRVDEMIEQGLIEEVAALYHNKISKTAQSAIGYKELFAYFNNEVSLPDAIDNIKKNTRHYAKRQMTWFRNKSDVTIVKINREHFDETVNETKQLISKWLNK